MGIFLNPHNKKIWKANIPLKIKIWMWLIDNDAILTKDNVIKRNWHDTISVVPCAHMMKALNI